MSGAHVLPVSAGQTSLRAEWTRGADFAAEPGAPVHLTIGARSTEAVLRGSQMTLVQDDAEIRSALDKVGRHLLRFDPADWPYRPDLAELRPATESVGAFVGGLSGGALGVVGGGLGCAIGAVVVALE